MLPAATMSSLAIYPCHRFSVTAIVIDTGDKFIAGDNDTGEQLSSMRTTPVNNNRR
jgi:hypothetical protein